MKETFNTGTPSPSNKPEGDDIALKILEMNDVEVDNALEALDIKHCQSSVQRIKHKLRLQSEPSPLRLVQDNHELLASNEPTYQISDTDNPSRNILAKTYDHLVAIFKPNSLAYAATISLVLCLSFVNFVMVNPVERGGVAQFSTSVSVPSAESYFETPFEVPFDQYRIKSHDQQFPAGQGEVFEKVLPVWHPIFDENTTTIAINTCLECHSEVFSGATHLL